VAVRMAVLFRLLAGETRSETVIEQLEAVGG